MQATGPNASMAGNDPGDLSGRAILAQQAGGAAAHEPLADGLRSWTRRVYECAWMAVRQYWTGERWVRVTDDLGNLAWVGLNRRVTLQDELASMPEGQRAEVMRQMMLQPGDPRLQQVLRVENDVTDLDVDITIEEGPDVPAQQAEQFAQLVQLAQSVPGSIPPDVLIAASALRNKGDLLARMKQHMEEQAQQAAQQAPIVAAKQQAEIRGLHAEASAEEALALERQHKALGRIAETHARVAESPVIPVDGPGIPPGLGGGGRGR